MALLFWHYRHAPSVPQRIYFKCLMNAPTRGSSTQGIHRFSETGGMIHLCNRNNVYLPYNPIVTFPLFFQSPLQED